MEPDRCEQSSCSVHRKGLPAFQVPLKKKKSKTLNVFQNWNIAFTGQYNFTHNANICSYFRGIWHIVGT